MYRCKQTLLPLVSICLLFMFFGVAQLYPERARAAVDGEIVLYGKGAQDDTVPGDVVCIVPFTDGIHDFQDMDRCQNDEARWYKLVNVPSATRFELYEHPDCDEGKQQNFFIFLKTVKNNFTMEQPLRLEDLKAVPNGNIVPGAPGIRMEYIWLSTGDDQIEGKMSCIWIKRSGVPDN